MYAQYKQKILDFYHTRKRLPSYREIMGLVGFKSTNAASRLVSKLLAEGVLERDRDGCLVPGGMLAAESGVPLLGLVEAGIPTVTEQVALNTISLDDLLLDSREGAYLLRVKGDSMIEAGIHDGDLVLADTREKLRAKPGDIVVAEVDGGWTLKYLREKRGKPYLEPANKKYSPIYPTESFSVAALIRAVIRKY